MKTPNTRNGSNDNRKPWCDPQLMEHGTIAALTQTFSLKSRGLGDDTFNVAVSTVR
jgi:hypothetical protein